MNPLNKFKDFVVASFFIVLTIFVLLTISAFYSTSPANAASCSTADEIIELYDGPTNNYIGVLDGSSAKGIVKFFEKASGILTKDFNWDSDVSEVVIFPHPQGVFVYFALTGDACNAVTANGNDTLSLRGPLPFLQHIVNTNEIDFVKIEEW